MLDPDARLALSGTRFTEVRALAEVASTNGQLAALARQGAPEGLVLVAGHQTDGRGRRGRCWRAPPGSSLLVTVLLRPPPAEAHLAATRTGLAAVAACAEVAGVAASLKWPNDVVVDAGKLGGILAEAVRGDPGPAVVVGLGLNVAWDLPLPPGGIDLRGLNGGRVDRTALLVAFLRALEERCRQPAGEVMVEYRHRCSTIGKRVRVELATEDVTGTAVCVDGEGRLVVEGPGGRRTMAAGEVVHLR